MNSPYINKSVSSSPRCYRVVPVAMESVADEVDCGELSVRHLHRFGVFLFIQLGAHLEAGFGGCGGDQLNNRPIGTQRLSAPIDRDERKETMLNFVPFASSRREMANSNREFELVCQLLKLDLPQAHAVPVAATAVGRDHQTFGFGVALPPHRRPPPADGVDGK